MAGQPKRRGKRSTMMLDPTVAQAIGLHSPTVAYTDAEVRAKLVRLRDGALDWWADLLAARCGDGIGVAMHAMSRANAELDRMDEKATGATGQKINILINGLDFSRLQFGSNVPASKQVGN